VSVDELRELDERIARVAGPWVERLCYLGAAVWAVILLVGLLRS
jgi:hypothetical protein